jgi:DNA-binding helix-hairpin-helix protein with protein kinase domain
MNREVWLVDAAGRRSADTLTRPLGGTGSQGSVWELGSRPDTIAKIVHRTDPYHLAARLRVMLSAPSDWTVRDERVVAAWPAATVHHADGRLIGYAAAKLVAPRYVHLPLLLARPARVRQLPDTTWAWWLRLAEELARTVHAAHQHGHVVGDLAPANVFATASGGAALIDTDGWQVHDAASGADLLCPCSRPEYTAPEDLDRPARRRPPASDGWALAVVLTQLMFLGFHPFGGVPDGDAVVEEADNVRAGQCWVLGGALRVPVTAPPARLLPDLLRRRLAEAVDAGRDHPDRRPRPLDWASALAHTRRRLVTCPIQPLHVYAPEAAPCPWCAMISAGARDPFPATVVHGSRR